jgi:hypothetical protein
MSTSFGSDSPLIHRGQHSYTHHTPGIIRLERSSSTRNGAGRGTNLARIPQIFQSAIGDLRSQGASLVRGATVVGSLRMQQQPACEDPAGRGQGAGWRAITPRSTLISGHETLPSQHGADGLEILLTHTRTHVVSLMDHPAPVMRIRVAPAYISAVPRIEDTRGPSLRR